MAGKAFLWLTLVAAPGLLNGQNAAFTGYPVTVPQGAGPNAITPGLDGALWYTISNGTIGRITTAGSFTEFAIPTANSSPQGITSGPDGALWFTEMRANQIGRITVAGVITEFALTTANSGPLGIAAGPDGALWFTQFNGNQIGRITTSGAVTEYGNSFGTEPAGITAGPDGAMWFTEYIQIGRISTSGAISSWSVPSTSGSAQSITTGPDGALWFAGGGSYHVGRITTSGSVSGYATFGLDPLAIATGPDGALWFTDSYSNSIGRVTTAGAVSDYLAPPANFLNLGTTGIAGGPNGTLWYTESGAGMVGEGVFPGASLVASPSNGYPSASLAFSGSLFGPNEKVVIYQNGIGSTVLATAATDASGPFGTILRRAALQPLPFGYRLFLGLGQSSKKLAPRASGWMPRRV